MECASTSLIIISNQKNFNVTNGGGDRHVDYWGPKAPSKPCPKLFRKINVGQNTRLDDSIG